MVKKKQFVKKSGFSYLEFIFSLFLFTTIIVISQQIIYNINNIIYENDKIMSLEIFALRIESHFKEVEEYEIGEDYLQYCYRNIIYVYMINNNDLIYIANNQLHVLIENIKEIYFLKNKYFLEITIIDLANLPYHTQIIIYDK